MNNGDRSPCLCLHPRPPSSDINGRASKARQGRSRCAGWPSANSDGIMSFRLAPKGRQRYFPGAMPSLTGLRSTGYDLPRLRRCEEFGWRRPLRSARLVITPEIAHLKRCAPAREAWGGIRAASHLEVRECATLSGSRRRGRVAVSGGVAPGYVISAPSGRYSAFIVYVKGPA
jgi:hypothetical protein